jgi:hypothetical protein
VQGRVGSYNNLTLCLDRSLAQPSSPLLDFVYLVINCHVVLLHPPAHVLGCMYVAGDSSQKLRRLGRELRDLRGKTKLPVAAAAACFVIQDADRPDKVSCTLCTPCTVLSLPLLTQDSFAKADAECTRWQTA